MGFAKWLAYTFIPTKKAQLIANISAKESGLNDIKKEIKIEKATLKRKDRIDRLQDRLTEQKYKIATYQSHLDYLNKQKKQKMSKSKKYWK